MTRRNLSLTFLVLGLFGTQLQAQTSKKKKPNATPPPVVETVQPQQVDDIIEEELVPVPLHDQGFHTPSINLDPYAGLIQAYQAPSPKRIVNGVGVYPKLKDTAQWNGRQAGTYSLQFKIRGLQQGDEVYLADHHIGGKYLRDTAWVDKKGWAVFTGTERLQRGMYLFVLPQKQGYFEFVVDDDQEFSIETDTAFYTGEYYPNMAVSGSEENLRFLNYQKGKTAVIEKLIAVDEQMKNDTLPEQKKALEEKRRALLMEKEDFDLNYIRQNPNSLLARFLYSMVDVPYPEHFPIDPITGLADSSFPYTWYKAHYWDHIDFGEDGLVRMPVNIMKQKMDFFFDKIILPDPDSCIQVCEFLLNKTAGSVEMEKYMTWYLTNRFESSNIMGQDKVFVYLALNTYCRGKAWWADSNTISKMCENAYRRAHTVIGQLAPPLELQDKNENWVNTASVKAPWTIMIFWDPTCGHCKEVMPKLAKIYNDNKDKGWKVIALSSGDKRSEWIDYMKAHPEMDGFIHLIRDKVQSEFMKQNLYAYYVIASPTIYVLDSNRKVVANRIDVEKIEEFIGHLEAIEKAKTKAE